MKSRGTGSTPVYPANWEVPIVWSIRIAWKAMTNESWSLGSNPRPPAILEYVCYITQA